MPNPKYPPPQYFHAMFDASLESIILVDRAGTIAFSNPRSAAMFGYETSELNGLPLERLVPDEAREKHARLHRQFQHEPHARPMNSGVDTVARRKDGSTFPVEIALLPANAEDAPFTGIFVRDITAQVAEADRVRQAGSLLRSTLESTGDGILVVDREGHISAHNEKFAEMWGIPAAVLSSGQDDVALRFVREQLRDPDAFQSKVRELYANPEAVSFDVIEFKDGRVFERYSQPQRLGGDVVGRVWSFRDVTMNRTSEWALQQSEESLRAMVDNAVFAIYRSTADGHLVMANSAMARMLGYSSPRELQALPDMAAIYRKPAERSQLIERYRDKDVVENVEVEWRRKDGQTVVVRLNGRPVRGQLGQLEYFEMIAEDVTDRRVLERQLRQAQKMEAVGLLAGGIAHDFNNLLTAILGTAELALQELPPGSPLRDPMNDVREAALRGASLTRKLLAFGRRQTLELHPINLAQLLEEFMPVMRRVIREDIRILTKAVDGGAVVKADAGAIEQILMNLITNARDAMPDGGSLVIQVERGQLEAQDVKHLGFGTPGEFAILVVSDTGAGMDGETKLRVFEPFFTTKPFGTGTGLGMAMVYGLVKQHNGFVDIDSARGVGTTVRIYLPLSAESPAAAATAPATEHLTGTETILLAEDEESVRRMSKRTLERHGYSVLAVADGAEAFELFLDHQKRIGLVVSDMVMPRMNGPQLVRAIRQRDPSMKVLLMTGYASAETAAAKAADPTIPVLSKPWMSDALLKAVRRVLDAPVA